MAIHLHLTFAAKKSLRILNAFSGMTRPIALSRCERVTNCCSLISFGSLLFGVGALIICRVWHKQWRERCAPEGALVLAVAVHRRECLLVCRE